MTDHRLKKQHKLLNHKLTKTAVATAAAFLVVGATATVFASNWEQGVDLSWPQGNTATFGQASDTFAICAQGGYATYKGYYTQPTYRNQVSSTIAQGKRAHTYLWDGTGSNQNATRTMLNKFLPQVQTPKGSIVALDYEENASGSVSANTANVILGLQMIKDAGFTPVLYSGEAYVKAHLDYKQILKQFPNVFWIARYPDYQVRKQPLRTSLPVLDGMNMVQFTSTYKAGGLDGDADFLGITKNGYDGTTTSKQGGTAVKTDSTTTAIKAGQIANNTAKSDIKVGDTVKVNFGASKWATGQSIPSWIKGHSYKVSQISSNKLLLSGVNSWIKRSDAEILLVNKTTTSSTSGTFKDGVYTITRQNSTFTADQTLRVFAYPGVQATGAKYHKGESVIYDGYVHNGNYIYVSYLTKTGHHHYIAVRNSSTRVPLGTFK